jgi:hypothetical protein
VSPAAAAAFAAAVAVRLAAAAAAAASAAAKAAAAAELALTAFIMALPKPAAVQEHNSRQSTGRQQLHEHIPATCCHCSTTTHHAKLPRVSRMQNTFTNQGPSD